MTGPWWINEDGTPEPFEPRPVRRGPVSRFLCWLGLHLWGPVGEGVGCAVCGAER